MRLEVLPDQETNNLLTTVKAIIKVPLKKSLVWSEKITLDPWEHLFREAPSN